MIMNCLHQGEGYIPITSPQQRLFNGQKSFAIFVNACCAEHDALHRVFYRPSNTRASALLFHSSYLAITRSADLSLVLLHCARRQTCFANGGQGINRQLEQEDVVEKPANVFVLGNGEQLALPEVSAISTLAAHQHRQT
jgi:hypothetical protein